MEYVAPGIPNIVKPNGNLFVGNKIGLVTMMMTCPFVAAPGANSPLERNALMFEIVNGTTAESIFVRP